MKTFGLPAGLLAMIYAFPATADAHYVPTNTSANNIYTSSIPTSTSANNTHTSPVSTSTSRNNTFLPATGSGPDYATSCNAEWNAYSAAYSSWTRLHNTVTTTTASLDGEVKFPIKYIANATTLCDLHPRVTCDNPIILSTGTVTRSDAITGYTTITHTFGSAYTGPSPSCTVQPCDCDPLWAAYSSSLTANATATSATPLTTPFCQNSSLAEHYSSLDSSIRGCGKCTIYGTHVQLVYWPEPTESVSRTRDYCATTPTANLTTYNSDAVITAYAGKSLGNASHVPTPTDPSKQTITADGHAFTEGTAYISIGSVWAADRCSHTFGTVTDAILAMPSSSVLSLRYFQDHFQRLMETDKITGYPVNYGDFQTPIPWSAWVGMNQCTSGPWGGPQCDVIDERSYLPQLAIPPQITELSPDFKNCQMWYNGLFDPPLALTEAKSADAITNPYVHSTPQTTSAKPAPTAEQNTLPTGYGGDQGHNDNSGGSGPNNEHETADTIPQPGSGNNGNNNGNGQGQGSSGSGSGSNNGGSGAGSVTSGSGSNSNSGSGSSNQGTSSNSGSNSDNHNNGNSGGSVGSYINSGMSPNSNSNSNGDQNQNNPSSGSSGSSLNSSNNDNHQQAVAHCPSNEPWTYTFTLNNGQEIHATGSNSVAVIGNVACTLNGPPQIVAEGVTASYLPGGVVFNEEHVYSFPNGSGADTVTATLGGDVHVAVQTQDAGVVVVDGTSLTPGDDATTLSNGEVLSAATNGVVVVTKYTVGQAAVSSSATQTGSSRTSDEPGGSATKSGSAPAASSSKGAAAGLVSTHGISSLAIGLFIAALLGA
ncbi:hypothetical protein TI39_contig4278g00005 [Zymoseptoria brevis]|uniref:Uncharacterized protein n=1 Tax=Zymoseptoria brevis TaxID=1047168 RepID=A0A0F4G9G9_9PEZI|nr:hypothetical protein TI39_contig4278g00005 [Zymoseptoria brevis]